MLSQMSPRSRTLINLQQLYGVKTLHIPLKQYTGFMFEKINVLWRNNNLITFYDRYINPEILRYECEWESVVKLI